MRRYLGEGLRDAPRVAVISGDALGNYVVVTPMVQMIRQQLRPSVLHYFGGTRTHELWSQEPLFDASMLVFGVSPAQSVCGLAALSAGQTYDLIVNVEADGWARAFAAIASKQETLVVGPCIDDTGRGDLDYPADARGQLWSDPDWTRPTLVERYSFLTSQFIGEIFARLCYLDGPVPRYCVPVRETDEEIPEVLVATSASLPEKLWGATNWLKAVRAIRDLGFSVGLLGASPAVGRRFWIGTVEEEALVASRNVTDLRGRLSLPEVVSALSRAKVVLSLDNGILHLAAATATPTIGLFRHGFHRLWAPPVEHVHALAPDEGKSVAELTVEAVLEAVRRHV